MTIVTVDAANSELNALLDRISAGDTELLIERDGKPVARLVPADPWEQLMTLVDEIHEFNRGVPVDELEADIAAAIREVRSGAK